MTKPGKTRALMACYRALLQRPILVIVACLVPVAIAALFLPSLATDVRSDAFLAEDNPALVYRQKIKEQFGLSDPLVLAIVDQRPGGVFTPATLRLLAALHEQLSQLPNVRANRITSLFGEDYIASAPDGLLIEPYYHADIDDQVLAQGVKTQVMDFPLHVGSLVAEGGEAALIVAEMIDESRAGQSYHEARRIVEQLTLPSGVEVHVAGEGAIIGYLGEYVDADARQLIPFTVLGITLILIAAFRSLSAALISISIAAVTLVLTTGTMAAVGSPFYVITNALPVILIGIAVADAVHVYSHYFELQSRSPDQAPGELVLEVMEDMWRPITLTSLTTSAGFLGLAFSAYMPPFRDFGLFAALGVTVAWLYSLIFLPAVMTLVKPVASASHQAGLQADQADLFHRALRTLGNFTRRHPAALVTCYALLALAGLAAATQLQVDEDPIEVFHPAAPIAQADRVINQHFDGSNTLDIVVETPEPEALFRIDHLRRIEAIQAYADSLPKVGGSVSIVDYLKQINRSLHEGEPEAYRLPVDSDLVAQYFLLFSATSDPTALEELVDYDYQNANIRLYLKSGGYQDIKLVMEALSAFAANNASDPDLQVTLSGRVAMNYFWIRDLSRSHFVGLGTAIALILLISTVLFRSLSAGILSLLPVACAVLLVYAAMALTHTPLGMGTSMFAAVTVGLGVDFAIHTLDRFRSLYHDNEGDMTKTFLEFYPTTGRALLYNFLAIAGGFGILILSKISSLTVFGAVVVLAVSMSFIASLTLLPALLALVGERFLANPSQRSSEL